MKQPRWEWENVPGGPLIDSDGWLILCIAAPILSILICVVAAALS